MENKFFSGKCDLKTQQKELYISNERRKHKTKDGGVVKSCVIKPSSLVFLTHKRCAKMAQFFYQQKTGSRRDLLFSCHKQLEEMSK